MSRRLLGCALALLVPCCGPGDGARQPAAAERWPLTVAVPGVLGYASAQLPEDELVALLQAAFGWAPHGLGGGEPVSVMLLDPRVVGGSLAVLLPIADEELFTASLDTWHALEPLGEDRFRLTVDPASGLGVALRAARSMGATPSLSGALRLLGSLGPPAVSLYVTVGEGLAWVVPAFEARAACRAARATVPGMAGGDGFELAAAVDVARARGAFRDAIEQWSAALQGALGAAGAMSGGRGDELPWDPAQVRLLPALLGFEQLELVQIVVRDETRDMLVGLGDASVPPPWHALDATLRLRWDPAAPVAAVLDALAPPPDLPDALLAAGYEPGPLADALGPWLAPLRAELLTDADSGGSAATGAALLDAWLAALRASGGAIALVALDEEHATAAGDRVVAEPSPPRADGDDGRRRVLLLVDLGPADGLDVRALAELAERTWARLTEPAGAEADGSAPAIPTRFVRRPDGHLAIVSDEGDIAATAGRQGRVGWLLQGDVDLAPAAACERFAAALERVDRSDDGEPVDGAGSTPRTVLRLRIPETSADAGRVELRTAPGGLDVVRSAGG